MNHPYSKKQSTFGRRWTSFFLFILFVLSGLGGISACHNNVKSSVATEAAQQDVKATDLCKRTVEHVALGVWPEQITPKGPELEVIQSTAGKAIEICQKEGLSEKQANCLLAATFQDGFEGARTCLGAKDQWPSWFSGGGIALPNVGVENPAP